MPVHISPALSARQVALSSLLTPVPAFCRALLEWEEGGGVEGGDRCPESLPADASYADVAIWIETDPLLNATPSCFAPSQTPLSKSAFTPALALREYISTVCHLSREPCTERTHDDKRTCIYRRERKKIYTVMEKVALSLFQAWFLRSVDIYLLLAAIVVDQSTSYTRATCTICLSTSSRFCDAAKNYSLDFSQIRFCAESLLGKDN